MSGEYCEECGCSPVGRHHYCERCYREAKGAGVESMRLACHDAVRKALRLEALRVGMTHERSLTCGCVLCRVWQAVPEWLREE